MTKAGSRWMVALGIGLSLGLGCDPASKNDGNPFVVDDSVLHTDREGAADECRFSTRGAVTAKYECDFLSVLAGNSPDSGESTLVFSPVPGTNFVSGVVVFSGSLPSEGTFGLKDVKSAVFNIRRPQQAHPTWLCQTEAGTPTVGALKIKFTSGAPSPVHGVFEALLIPADGKTSGNVIFHGEF